MTSVHDNALQSTKKLLIWAPRRADALARAAFFDPAHPAPVGAWATVSGSARSTLRK